MPTKPSPVLQLAKRGRRRINARQIGNVPEAPYVPLWLAKEPDEAEVLESGGLVIGYQIANRGRLVFAPVRFPLMQIAHLHVCAEFVDIRPEDDSNVMASFQFTWMNCDGEIRSLFTEPTILPRDGDVFRFAAPVITAQLKDEVAAGKVPVEDLKGMVDTDIALSCAFTCIVLTEGAGLIVRSVWLEVSS